MNTQFGPMTAPLVSVVTVTYNYAQYIESCIKSVREQTYANIEHVVLDNGSTDDTSSILERLSKDQSGIPGRSFRTLRVNDNINLMGGCIRAFAETRGRFVIFLDADDYLFPTCVEHHIRAFMASRISVGATSTSMFSTYEEEFVTSTSGSGFGQYVSSGRGQQSRFARAVDLPSLGPTADLDLALDALHLVTRDTTDWVWSPSSALCFRREMVELMFRRHPALHANVDSYLVIGINLLTESILIDRELVLYRHHGGNSFSKNPKIANFYNFDTSDTRNGIRVLYGEILRTFIGLAPLLARQLESHEIFFEAIQRLTLCMGMSDEALKTSSPLLDFLTEHHAALTGAFGAAVFDGWVRRTANSRADLRYADKLTKSPLART